MRRLRYLVLLLVPILCAASPPTQKLQLRFLVVLYTSSFARTLTPAQVERLHQEVAEFVDFYQESAGDVLDLDLTLLQIDRPLQLHEIQEISKGRYYLSRENIEAELVLRGMGEREFDEVVCFYAWDGQNRYQAQLAYGGGAVGPDGKFLGDAGYNSIGIFAWDPGRISQIMIHEVLHNIDDMFSRSGMPGAFYSSDDMSRHIEELVRDWPGAFEPEFSDAQILDLAERERKGEEGYPWKAQLVYYRWMLRRTSRDDWMRLRYGRKLEVAETDRTLRPLYSTLIYSAANDSIYLPVLFRASQNRHIEGAQIVAGPSGTNLDEVRYEHTDFEGKALFRNAFYAGWVAAPKEPGGVRLRALGKGEPLAATVTVAPTRTAVVDLSPERTFYRDKGRAPRLIVAVRAERFQGGGPGIGGAVVTSEISGQRLLFREKGSGWYEAELRSLPPGTTSISVHARKDGWAILPASTTLHNLMSWDLETTPVVEAQRGMPLEIWVRAVKNEFVDTVRVVARLGETEVRMEPAGEGYFRARFPSVPDGVDHLQVTARTETAGRVGAQVLQKKVPLRASVRGQIVAEDEVVGQAGKPLTIAARVRNRMGAVLIGYAVSLVAVVGSQVVPLVDLEGDGRFVGEIELPPGLHRAKIVGLDGRLGVKNFRIRVEP